MFQSLNNKNLTASIFKRRDQNYPIGESISRMSRITGPKIRNGTCFLANCRANMVIQRIVKCVAKPGRTRKACWTSTFFLKFYARFQRSAESCLITRTETQLDSLSRQTKHSKVDHPALKRYLLQTFGPPLIGRNFQRFVSIRPVLHHGYLMLCWDSMYIIRHSVL